MTSWFGGTKENPWPYDYPQYVERDPFGMMQVVEPGQIIVPHGSLGDDGLPTQTPGEPTGTGTEFIGEATTQPAGTSTGSVYVPTYLVGTPLADVWLNAWIATNDANQATAAVQRDSQYDTYFPGNRRADGSVLYGEAQYRSIIEMFDDTLLGFGLNPDIFQGKYGTLISGLVSPAEFVQRVEIVYEGIIDQAPAVMEFFAATHGIDITPAAVFAAFLDPDIDQMLASGEISVAQVGGTASQKGFTISTDFATKLVQAGMDTTSEAAQFFSLAEGALPTLQVLASRHNDPDDDFDIGEFAEGQIFGDPEQRNRMRRLLAQERSTFSMGATGAGAFAADESGRRSGLTTR